MQLWGAKCAYGNNRNPLRWGQAKACPTLPFVDYFDGVDGRIIAGRGECDVKLALRVRLESVSVVGGRAFAALRLLEDVKSAPQSLAVAEDVEHTAAHAAARRRSRTETGFG